MSRSACTLDVGGNCSRDCAGRHLHRHGDLADGAPLPTQGDELHAIVFREPRWTAPFSTFTSTRSRAALMRSLMAARSAFAALVDWPERGPACNSEFSVFHVVDVLADDRGLGETLSARMG